MYESEFQLPSESYEFPGENEGEFGYEAEGETLEAQLASELLEISTEAELDQFLGKLAGSVLKGASTFTKSPVGKALGGVLKNVAKTALPAVGGALGSMVLPGVGTAIGSKLGSLAGGLIKEEEAEMMSEAEAEYEAAQRYVRFARAAVGNAARVPRNVPYQAAVRAASISAARRYAPSLLRSDQPMSPWRQRRRRSYGPRPSWSYAEPMPYWGDPGDGYGYGAAPQPWSTDGVDFTGEAEAAAAGPAGPRAAEGRWVRRGGRIVVHGV